MNKLWIDPLPIFLTEKCNEKCHYCDIPLIKHPKSVTLDLVKKHHYIIDFCNKHNIQINLTGGEPGLLSPEIIEYFINSTKKIISINTNGIFIDRYKKLIDTYQIPLIYHITNFEKFKENKNATNVIIITHKNINNVIDFINEYKSTHFELRFVRIKHNSHKNLKLNPDEFELIKKLTYKTSNIKLWFNNLIDYHNQKLNKEYINTIKLCNKYIPMPQINLATEEILKCCKSYIEMDKIKLNKFLFHEVMLGNGYKYFDSDLMQICQTCNVNEILTDKIIYNSLIKKKLLK